MRATLLEWFRSTPRTDSHIVSLPNGGNSVSTPSVTNEHKVQRTLAVDFFHKGTPIHCMCTVERQQEARLLLRISAEMGTLSLASLVGNEHGQIEIDNLLIPFRVLRIRLPYVDILTAPQQVRPARRQLLRAPATFVVRLRRQGSCGLWITGQGTDLSAGGCSFLLTPPCVPIPNARYDLDMLLTLPRSGEIRPLLNGTVQWVKDSSRHIATGIEIQHPEQRKVLTLAVTEIQQALTRRYESSLA